MYTATIKNKEIINGQMNVTVDFSNGTTTVTETCIPQDMEGFKHWVKSRLATFNGAEEIETTYSVNDAVDITEPTPTAPTAEEIAKNEWFVNYSRLREVQSLIDLSVLTGNETKVVALRDKVRTDFKPEYLNLI